MEDGDHMGELEVSGQSESRIESIAERRRLLCLTGVRNGYGYGSKERTYEERVEVERQA